MVQDPWMVEATVPFFMTASVPSDDCWSNRGASPSWISFCSQLAVCTIWGLA